MSAFVTCTPEKMTQEQVLSALELLGYDKAKVEIGSKLHLYGYRGDERGETADIVVRRKHISSSSNDLGFAKTENGYKLIVSEYDENYMAAKHGGSVRFSKMFPQIAATSKVIDNARAKKLRVQLPAEGLRWGKQIKLSFER